MICSKEEDGPHAAGIRGAAPDELPDAPVLVEVEYSTLNYKDALAVTGAAPVVRRYPMAAGIDLAGVVVESADPGWKAGDRVLVNGYGLGEVHWGGYARYARLQPEWLVRIPENLSARQAMGIGTAGYTAMLSVLALADAGVTSGKIVVTGAAGGVGSVAIALLAQRGYSVTACSGRTDSEGDYLRGLGAGELLAREEVSGDAPPLGRELWDGAVDSVGSKVLANILAQTRYGGAVAACGLAAGADLPATVMPFILRGVRLLGIDSVMAPMPLRERAWKHLAEELDLDLLETMMSDHTLEDVPELCGKILAGGVRGRSVIRVE
ncbi:MAG: oxidoreductase [Gammaproteobacteria bacterium AqS3]|nr:oxidoreductase [Gammaproteobacteria bacterium AqS3]